MGPEGIGATAQRSLKDCRQARRQCRNDRRPLPLPRDGPGAGRITALVIGVLLVLISLGLLGGGGVALWADRTQRDEGYVTTDVHEFSTSGSALATERVDLGSPGVGWLYSRLLLGRVRIRVTPVSPGSALFVGIGHSTDVDRYLAGVSHSLISDFRGNGVQVIGGGTPGFAPGTQDFWVASATGPGAQTLAWDPANGSWTVVVMKADGRPGSTWGRTWEPPCRPCFGSASACWREGRSSWSAGCS